MKRSEPTRRPYRRLTPSDLKSPEASYDLTCRRCGLTANYRVGHVFMDPEAGIDSSLRPQDAIAFTGYFRCNGCQGGGPWDFPAQTLLALIADSFACEQGRDSPVRLGRLSAFDGARFRYATDAEAHLKGLIAAEPGRSYLWSRLGNLYQHGGRTDLAREAFRKALELDGEDIESHHSLGGILFAEGALPEAAGHLRQVLKHARKRKELDRELLEGMVRASLERLIDAHARTDGAIQVFPEPAPDEMGERSEAATLIVKQLDLSSESSWKELVSMVLGERWSGREEPSTSAAPRWMRRSVVDPALFRGTPARNEPCSCGSGSKYKNCCGRG